MVFDCEDGKQASSFDGMLDRLATYLGCKFEHGGDLLLMIRNLMETELEKPKPCASTADDVDKAIWTIELTSYVKRKSKITENLKRCYAIVWGQCTEHMKAKLRAEPGF